MGVLQLRKGCVCWLYASFCHCSEPSIFFSNPWLSFFFLLWLFFYYCSNREKNIHCFIESLLLQELATRGVDFLLLHFSHLETMADTTTSGPAEDLSVQDVAHEEAVAQSETGNGPVELADAATSQPENEGQNTQVEVINLSSSEPNPFDVLGFDLSEPRTLTIDDFMVIPTATVKWENLTPEQRRAYEQVGFDASGHKHSEIRCMKVLDGTSETSWAELTDEQRGVAMELGCDSLGIRHEMGRLATIANRALLKDPDIKKKRWHLLTPAQQTSATMLGHDNGGGIWNARVSSEWCENGVSPQSSLQNPFALPKGAESVIRIARNMGIGFSGTGICMKKLSLDTDEDVVAATRLLPQVEPAGAAADQQPAVAGRADVPDAVFEQGDEVVPQTPQNDKPPRRQPTPQELGRVPSADVGVDVVVYATPEKRFDPTGMTVEEITQKCTKLEITVTEPGTIGMRWDDSESGIVAGVTEGLPAHRLGVRPGCQVVAVQGQWVEKVEAFDVLMDHVTERPFKVKFKLP